MTRPVRVLLVFPDLQEYKAPGAVPHKKRVRSGLSLLLVYVSGGS